MKSKTINCFFLAIILIIIFVIIFISSSSQNKQSVYIDLSESYLSDFNIVDDKVEIVCYITICNKYNVDKTVLINGDFSNEVKNGLILEETLYATDLNGDRCQYTINAKDSDSFYISFIGTFAGLECMTDRQLPPISIEEIS